MSDLALPAPRATASRPAAGLTAVATMVTRCLRLGLRNVDGLITALALPVMLMLIFVYLFGGALHTGTSYVNYVVPGVLLVCLGFGTGTTAVTVSQDMTGSIIDRLRSMNTPATSLITGHVVASTLRNLISTALVFGVAFAIGFRPSAGALAWLAAIGLLALFIVALFLAGRGDRPAGPVRRGGRRDDLPDRLPALPEQRVRPGQHDAWLAPGVRRAPAGQRGHRRAARPAAAQAQRAPPRSPRWPGAWASSRSRWPAPARRSGSAHVRPRPGPRLSRRSWGTGARSALSQPPVLFLDPAVLRCPRAHNWGNWRDGRSSSSNSFAAWPTSSGSGEPTTSTSLVS